MTFTPAMADFMLAQAALLHDAWLFVVIRSARIPRQCGGPVPDFDGTETLVRRRK